MEPTCPAGQHAAGGQIAAHPFGQLLRYFYNHNPFYVISAALVLGGLHVLFHDRDAVAHPNALTFNSWLLLGVLGGYALLLALTALRTLRVRRTF
jgi:hypothetical protein